jgi:hypothetical protein
MARVHGSNGRIYVDQYNLSGRANKLDLSMEIDLPDVSAFEDSGHAFVAGRPGWELDVEAFADYADDEIDEIINGFLTGTHYVAAYFGGASAGSNGYEGVGNLTKQSRLSDNNDAAKMKFTFNGAEGTFMGRSSLLNSALAVTGTGAQTGINYGATVPSGTLIVLTSRVVAVSGSGSITVALQESSDNGGGDAYATAIAGSAQTALGVVRSTATAGGTLGGWWRTNVTALSGFTSVTLRTSVAFLPARA